MKSILRRFMGLVLALALVFSISIPIYAAENSGIKAYILKQIASRNKGEHPGEL